MAAAAVLAAVWMLRGVLLLMAACGWFRLALKCRIVNGFSQWVGDACPWAHDMACEGSSGRGVGVCSVRRVVVVGTFVVFHSSCMLAVVWLLNCLMSMCVVAWLKPHGLGCFVVVLCACVCQLDTPRWCKDG